jgi:hypothetical protein
MVSSAIPLITLARMPALLMNGSRASRWSGVLLGLAIVICLLLAWRQWQILEPGLVSFDSLDQYDQAVTGEYNDHHPPLMAVLMAGILALGGRIEHITLIQCTAAILGVFFFAYQCFRAYAGPRFGRGSAAVAALTVLWILLSRWSPLGVYAMTLWKDVWLLVCFCWIGGLSLRIFRTSTGRWTLSFSVQLLLYLALVTAAVLLRHNAIVVAPVFCVLWVVFLRPVLKPRYLILAALLPPVLAWGVQVSMYRTLHVVSTPTDRYPKGYELASLC